MKKLILLISVAVSLMAADYRAGTAKVDITPEGPIWMAGYASRKKPSEGVLQKLWAKALALDDNKGGRIVIVSTDILGLPRSVSDVVGARVEKQFGLARSRLLLNSSHTHTGPVIGGRLQVMYDLDDQNSRAVSAYTSKLTDQLVSAAGSALADLSAASIAYGAGSLGFAVNRREFTPNGGVRIGVNPNGPVDHSVPVMRITKADGSLKAVLFGYACHNTTLTGEHYMLSGDYAGVAQEEIEKARPGATALFIMLCGADQNPNPRGQSDHVRQHGGALAREVGRVLDGNLETIKGEIRAVLRMKDLPLAQHSRDDFEKMQSDSDPYRKRLAIQMLRAYDERRPVRTVLYPVQAMRIGRNFGIVALGGEVVVDYALWTKREFPRHKLIVAGYSNDVMCYIPTARILKEGGYEAVQSMVYYAQPGPFAPEVEEMIHATIREVMKRVGF